MYNLQNHCFCRSAWNVNSEKLIISTKLKNKIVTAICFLHVTIFSFVRLHEYILCMPSSNLISIDIDWICFMIKIDDYIVWMGILGKYTWLLFVYIWNIMCSKYTFGNAGVVIFSDVVFEVCIQLKINQRNRFGLWC